EHFIFLISMQGIDVQFVSDILDQTPNLIRGMEYSVLSPDLNWSFVIKPAQHHLDILTHLGLVVGSDDHIPPAQVQIILQKYGDGLRWKRVFQLSIESIDFSYSGSKPGWQQHDFIPFLKNTTCHPSGIATIIMKIIVIGPENMLHRETAIDKIVVAGNVNIF